MLTDHLGSLAFYAIAMLLVVHSLPPLADCLLDMIRVSLLMSLS